MTNTPHTLTINGLKLISQEGAAHELGCSMSTVRRLVLSGQLQRVRVLGRWLIDCTTVDKVKETRS